MRPPLGLFSRGKVVPGDFGACFSHVKPLFVGMMAYVPIFLRPLFRNDLDLDDFVSKVLGKANPSQNCEMPD